MEMWKMCIDFTKEKKTAQVLSDSITIDLP